MEAGSALESIPAIVRILIVFVLILLAIKRRWLLGNAFLVGSLGLGALFSMAPAAIGRSMGMALVQPKTLCLSIVVGLILVLSHSLERGGQMARLLNSFEGLVRKPQVNLVIFPALIGLLPMPGGAIFSAPMVKRMGLRHHLSGAHLSYINYWFRHIWEYWWPLYPGVLLATALSGVDLWRLVFFALPLTLVAVIAGYWPLRANALLHVDKGSVTHSSNAGTFLVELGPIAMVIFGGLGLGMLMPLLLPGRLLPVAKELGLIIALLLAIGWVWRMNKMAWAQRWRIIRQPAMLKMLYMVAAILIFKGILEASGAVSQLSMEMLQYHIPLMPICMILPFVVGGVAGITIAFVGTTFPILISLIQTLAQTHLMLPYLILALACGFMGVLLSPMHLCLLLSNEYFETELIPVYRHMGIPLGVMLIASVAYFGVLYYFMN
jgi:uncharacterized protein